MKLTLKDFVDEPHINRVPEKKIIKEEKILEVQVKSTPRPPSTNITPDIKATPDRSLVDRASEHIKNISIKEQNSFEQPLPAVIPGSMQDVVQKLKFLESWVAKISTYGPGGGAGDVLSLDHPVKLVTGNYTINRKDYYVGINASSAVNIVLPDSIGYSGRKLIIKDESGNCASNPITVSGTVDNDPGGFILQQNNGGIQLIYREGWRII